MVRKLRKNSICLMLAVSVFIFLFMQGAISASAETTDDNLLINPGFEMATSEENPIPGWTIHSELSDGNQAEVLDHISHSGANSLLIKDTSPSKAVVVYSDPIPIEQGHSFQLKLNATDSSGTVYVSVRQYKNSTDHVINEWITPQSLSNIGQSNAWTQYQIDGHANPGANYVRVLVYTVSSTLGEAILDDFHLTMTDDSGGSIDYEEENLGSMVHNLVFNREGYYTDSTGKTIAYVIQAGDPNILLVVDTEDGQVIRSVPVVDTVNGVEHKGAYLRGFTVQPDGTVYMGGTPSKLFKYVPGEDRVHYLRNLPGSATFDLKNGPPGILIGGTYNRNEAFEYHIETGEMINLGRIHPDEMYVYSVAYDEEQS